MLYLIGVNHDCQRHQMDAVLCPCQEDLERLIRMTIDRRGPSVIAVEESDDTLGQQESIPRKVARQHGIRCVFIEPRDTRRMQIGSKCNSQIRLEISLSGSWHGCPSILLPAAALAVEMALSFPKREECWVEELKEHFRSDVVLVLGANHIGSFGARLNGLGVESEVLYREIGVTEAQKAEFEAAKRFPSGHPALFCALLQELSITPASTVPASFPRPLEKSDI